MARLFGATGDFVTAGVDALPTTGQLALWWYPTFAQADDALHYIFTVGAVPATSSFLCSKTAANALTAGWRTSAVNHIVSVATGSYTLNQNAWNSFLATWDDTANETRLYLNGTEIGTQVATLVTHTTVAAWTIGNINTATADARGRLAEVAVYSRIFTSAQRQAFFDGFAPNHPLCGPNGVHYWPMHGGNLSDLWGSQALADAGAPTNPTTEALDPVIRREGIRNNKPGRLFR